MKLRSELVINLEKAWAAQDDSKSNIDIIMPEGVTDYIVTDYDGVESLYYVKDGKIYNEEYKPCGMLKMALNDNIKRA